MAFDEIGERDQARTCYQDVLRINPEHARALQCMKESRTGEKGREVADNHLQAKLSPHGRDTKFYEDAFNRVYREDHHSLDRSTFVVCAMFTSDNAKFLKHVNRLIKSCENYALPYSIYEIPRIHTSISPHGQADPTYTKANFILYNMQRFSHKNVLYLDSDVFFLEHPSVIVKISAAYYDFAIYNWLADQHNECYIPIDMNIHKSGLDSTLYKFFFYISSYCTEQLQCSGAVQFYGNSLSSRHLLEIWQTVIEENPDCPDDECLDYAFNNFFKKSGDKSSNKTADKNLLKTFWLDKSYLRYPWWPHVKPVILHSGLPFLGRSVHLDQIKDRKRIYTDKCMPKSTPFIFPPDCLIDIQNSRLLKIEHNQIVKTIPLPHDFWIYPEDVELS
jgi:hypothetical protein